MKDGPGKEKVLTETEKNEEKIKILDPDGTLGLKIVEEDGIGENTVVEEGTSEKENNVR